jgi:hypothetical protein
VIPDDPELTQTDRHWVGLQIPDDPPMAFFGFLMPTEEQNHRLANIIGWVRTAKEILPTINDGAVPAEYIVKTSALLDRMYLIAIALRDQAAIAPPLESGRRAA